MESFENIKNKIIRNSNGEIISANNFGICEYIVFDRSLGAYSDAMFRIDGYFEQNYLGHLRTYVEYDGGILPLDDFFSRGYRKPTQSEIDDYIKYDS